MGLRFDLVENSSYLITKKEGDPYLEKLGGDEEVLSAVGPARVQHDAAEHPSLIHSVHALVDFVHHSERAELHVLPSFNEK